MFTTDLFEQNSRPVTVCFGRMNPPTLGHGQLLKTVSDNAGNGDYYIFATKTHKLPDNPLPYDVKFKFLQAMFPEYAEHMVYDPSLKTIIQVAQWLYDKGYTELNFVAGSDRLPEFSKLLNTYNGKGQPGDKGYYIFTKINMISAGDRDPDAEGLAGISASKARAAAEAGNFEDFIAKTGAGDLAKPLYDAVRKAQGVSEDIAPVSQDTTSPIHGKPVEEEAAGVGVVAANRKMAKDPRYSMSITKDVKPSTPKNMLRSLRLAEGPVSDIAKAIAAMGSVGTALGVKQTLQRQQDKKEQEQRRQEKEKRLNDPQVQQDFENWFKQQEQQRIEKLQTEPVNEKWSQKQRKSVNCNNPKGFSQKAHCAGRKARQSGRDTKSVPVSESKQTELSVIPMIKKFLPIVKEELKLEKLPKIKVQRHIEVHNGQATFGRFVNDEQVIYVGIADRHPVDVLRTLAHELVHWKQFVEGRIEPDSGKTGSPIENEAHAVAGILMRHFNKKYPDAIKLNNIELQESQDYVLGNVGYSSALNPVAWENQELKPEVRDRLLKISGEFVKYLEVPGFDVLDVVLTGSMANYNWTEYSDFDLHVVTNYSDLECEDLAETFYRAKKELWNNNHDITIGGHEVEMYVEDAAKPPVSAGVYSILDNRWIKKPVYDKPEIDKSAVNAKVRDMLQQIKSAIASADSPTDIQRIKDKLRKMRRAGLDSVGEFSVENLTYKILRNMGILNKMSDIQTREQDQQLSLPENKKKINSAQLIEKKRRKKRKTRSVGGPYYGYYYGSGTASYSGSEGGDSGGMEEGELIPWPKGTVKVDVSDVYDWYKLGQHISNLKGLGKHDFGKGPPQTVMAFGSEPLEHEYIKDLNKIGLKTYDIDEGLAEGTFNKCFDEACELYDKAVEKDLNPILYQVADYKGDGSNADSRWAKLPQHVWSHYVTVIGDTVYDPTAKQFGPDKSEKYNINQLEKEWGKIYKIRPREQGVAEAQDQENHLPSVNLAKQNLNRILEAAQRIYDDWDESDVDTYSGGGICHLIADAICSVMSDRGIECTTVSCNFEQHVYVAIKVEEGVYTIDIPYGIYEQGGGYSWKKLPDIKFDARDVVFYKQSSDPDEFDNYTALEESQQGVTEATDQIPLGPQLFVSRQTTMESIKPRAAAWTSTAQQTDQGFTSDWVEWCKDNMGHWVTDTGILYDVAPGARILRLQTDRDLIKIARQYGLEIKNTYDLLTNMDWEVLRQDYDAIHYKPRGRDLFMGAWDVESTAWFDKKFLINPRKVKIDTGKTEIGQQGVAEALSETFDQPYTLTWKEGDFGHITTFAVLNDGSFLEIRFNRDSPILDSWTVEFGRNGSQEITGEGDQQRIFATVLSAIKTFINDRKPANIYFSAVKHKDPRGKRTSLYDRLVKTYAEQLGYRTQKVNDSYEVGYDLTRIDKQGVAEENDIKLKLSPTSPKAQEWIEKVYNKFPGTWQNNHVMTWGEGENQQFAMFELVPSMSKRDAVEIKWFQAYPLRQGVGSKAIEVLQDLAQQDDISLTLYPWDKGQISQAKLIKFYKKYGFKPTMKGSKNMVWSKQGVAENNLTEFAPSPDYRDEDDRQHMSLLEFAEIIKLFLGSEYTMIDHKTPEQVSVKFYPKDRTSGHNGAVLYSIIGKKQNEYPTVNFQLIDYEQGPQVGRGRRAGAAILKTRTNALKIADIIYNTMGLPQQDRQVEENFADSKNPGRKGLAKRMGVPTKASVTRLRQIAKSSSGEKQRMAHWMANMKAGKKK